MKKRIIKIALMSISMLALASCKQEELVQAATQAVDNNRVVFASVEEYESLFADPNTTDEKVNAIAARYGTFTENARISGFEQAEDTLYSAFLQKILNDDYIVQIQDWIIKLDKLNEQVLVLDKKYLDQYIDLVNSNLSNTNIMVFSTEDQVIPMLQEGYTAGSANARVNGLFCKGVNFTDRRFSERYFVEDKIGYFGTVPVQGELYLRSYSDYDNNGFYFELYGSVFSEFKYSGSFYSSKIKYIGFNCSAKWYVNCSKSASSDYNEYTLTSSTDDIAGNPHIFYRGSKNVSKSEVQIKGITKKTDGTLYTSPAFIDNRSN